jgi:hypothetical protein
MIVGDHDFDGHGNLGFPRRSAAIEGETQRFLPSPHPTLRGCGLRKKRSFWFDYQIL